jgi:disulfide bond formation protein DsbB
MMLATVLTIRAYAGFVLLASALVLGAVLLSQYWGGLAPCELCILQRWPWTAAITISLVALLAGSRPALPWLGLILALVFAAGVIFAGYHVGVEQHWVAGPSACSAGGGAATVEEMRRQILGAPVVRCDEVPWSLLGVSLAGWNLLASLAMTAVSAAVFAVARRPGLTATRAASRGAA